MTELRKARDGNPERFSDKPEQNRNGIHMLELIVFYYHNMLEQCL